MEEATEGKTSEEPLASTEDKVVAEPEVAAEVAPVVTAPSAEVCKSRCDHQN